MISAGPTIKNPNATYLKSRGLWFTYVVGVLVLHLTLLSIPFVSIPLAWTITTVIHNTIHFIFLHLLKGVPWISDDQGACNKLTHWEQIDNGKQFTKTRKFLTVAPALMFFLACFYTEYDRRHFVVNYIATLLVILPKLPSFHGIRILGINK